ncbi:neuronal PAS domain-containing protein 4B [Clupea harengus]|uniref:Neuronal PAS domain-containing protein 4B n=1 Tax=Clupea harengus TaxID=7950 RepID=A0A8M1KRZ8_CLUHA|nr:neuronal PAS domain-containing protein 4B [Clupea harengus]
MLRSTKGASKARRDQINAEIRNLKELLPISDADKARISYLHIMSLACMYTRKSVFFSQDMSISARHEERRSGSLLSLDELSELMNSLPGFLLLISSEGKLLYLSDNVAEHLGHSMVDLVSQSDSVFDIIDPNDHFILRSNLVPTTTTDTDRLFRCRFNTSKFIRRQGAGNKLTLVRARCLSLPTSASPYWSSNPVWMCSCSPLEPRTPYPASSMNPLLTPPPDQSFFLACFHSRHARDMKLLDAHDRRDYVFTCLSHWSVEWLRGCIFLYLSVISVYFGSISVYLGYDVGTLRSRSWYSLLHPRDLSHASEKHCALLRESRERRVEMVVRVEALGGSWVWLFMVLQLETGDQPISCLNYVISESEAWSVRQQLCLEQNQLTLYLGGSGGAPYPDSLGLPCQSDPLASPDQVFTPSSSGLSAQSFDFNLPTSSQSSSDELGGAGPLDPRHPHCPPQQQQHLLLHPQEGFAQLGQWSGHTGPLQAKLESSTSSVSSPPFHPNMHLPPLHPLSPLAMPTPQLKGELECTPPYTPRFGGVSSFLFGDEQFGFDAFAAGASATALAGSGLPVTRVTSASCAQPLTTPHLGLPLPPEAARQKPHYGKLPLEHKMAASVEYTTMALPEIRGPLYVDVSHGHYPALPEGLLTPEASPTKQSFTPTFFPKSGREKEIERLEISLLAQYISAVAEGFYDNPLHPKPSDPRHPVAPQQSHQNEPVPAGELYPANAWAAMDFQPVPEESSLFEESIVVDMSPSSPNPLTSSSSSSSSSPFSPFSSSSSCYMQCSPPAPENWPSPCQSQVAQSPIGEYHFSSVQSARCNHPVGGGLLGPGLGEEGEAFSGMDLEMEEVEASMLPTSQSFSIPASPESALPPPTGTTALPAPAPAPGPSCAQSLLEELVAMETVFVADALMPPAVGQHPELYQLPLNSSPYGIYPGEHPHKHRDLHRPRPHLQAASTEGLDVEVVRASTEGVDVEVVRASTEGVDVEVIRASKHLGLLLEHRLDWGRSIKKRDALRLDRQGRRAGSVVDTELDSLMSVAERRILYKLMSVMDNGCH